MKNIYKHLVSALLPFAMALTAHAGPITLSTDNFTCSVAESNCASTAGVSSIGGGGVSFYVDDSESIYGNGVLTESVEGAVSGSLASGSQIGYSYDFSLYASLLSGNSDWELIISVLDDSTTIATTSIDGMYSEQDSGPFTGSGDMTTTNSFSNGDDLTVEYLLMVTESANENLPTVITVPEGSSIDINPNVGSSTPEPASLGLMGAGLIAAGLLGRKRRKN